VPAGDLLVCQKGIGCFFHNHQERSRANGC
jgi:hypothetical protein